MLVMFSLLKKNKQEETDFCLIAQINEKTMFQFSDIPSGFHSLWNNWMSSQCSNTPALVYSVGGMEPVGFAFPET